MSPRDLLPVKPRLKVRKPNKREKGEEDRTIVEESPSHTLRHHRFLVDESSDGKNPPDDFRLIPCRLERTSDHLQPKIEVTLTKTSQTLPGDQYPWFVTDEHR